MVPRCITRNKCKWITLALLITLFAFAYIGRTGVSIIKTIVLYSSPENGLEIVDQFLQRPNGSLGLIRMLRPIGAGGSTTSLVDVIIPEKLSYPIDTREWDIDHHNVLSPYLRLTLSAFYALDVFKLDENRISDILLIGLGGGTANSYIRHTLQAVFTTVVEIDPIAVELAQRYFGFKQDYRQKCIIQDGVVYIRNAAKNNERFDGIFIDACDLGSHKSNCPTTSFLHQTVIELYPKILNSQGVLIINFLERDKHDPISHLDNVLLSLKKVFDGCRALDIPYFLNSVIICVKQKQRAEYLKSNEFNKSVADFQAKLWMDRKCLPYCI